MMQLSLHLAPVLWCMLNELWFNASSCTAVVT